MAAKYWVGGTGNWDQSTTTHWSDSDGGAGGAVIPTAADDVFINANSGAGTITVTVNAPCRSLNTTNSSVATLVHNSGITITVGDGTAGSGNVALDLSGITTYTLGSTTTSAWSFVSTSATVQTVNFNGKRHGNVTFNATSNGSWQLTGTMGTSSVDTNQVTTLTKGTLDTNGQTCHWGAFINNGTNVRTITLGASTINIYGQGNIYNWTTTNLTFTANTATTNFVGVSPSLTPGSTTAHNNWVFTATGTPEITNAFTCANLTINGAASKTGNFLIYAACTVTGTFTVTGNSSINRVLLRSDTFGTNRTITVNTTVTVSNCDFRNITGAGSASWNQASATLFGDAGGNSGITFTTAATQTYSGTSGGNWSANAWTSRVPLPQDDVVISSAFSASQTITADMPRLGKTITWTGSSGSPTWAFNSTSNEIFGGVTLISGMTISGTQTLTFRGASSFTLTSATKQYSQAIVFTATGGTYSLADDFNTASTWFLNNGTFDAAGFNVTAQTFGSNGSSTRAITMGAGTWTTTTTSATNAWLMGSTGMTFSGASATIVISGTSANTRTFAGAGFTYGTLTYTLSGSTGELDITGSNTFGTINFSDASNARTLAFTAGTTTTITTLFNVNGTSGKLMTIGSITASGHTLSKSSGTVSCDYLSISRSTAGGGASWYAGANSTDGGNNSGWVFTAPPTTGSTITGDEGLVS